MILKEKSEIWIIKKFLILIKKLKLVKYLEIMKQPRHNNQNMLIIYRFVSKKIPLIFQWYLLVCRCKQYYLLSTAACSMGRQRL